MRCLISHVVQIRTSFKNTKILKKACDKREVPIELAEKGKQITKKLYSTPVTGVAAFQLKGWKYPAVVQSDGTCQADNYGGSWGKQEEMDALSQEYGVALATETLGKQGYRLQTTRSEEGVQELVFVS